MDALFDFLLSGMSFGNLKSMLGLSAIGFALLAALYWGAL